MLGLKLTCVRKTGQWNIPVPVHKRFIWIATEYMKVCLKFMVCSCSEPFWITRHSEKFLKGGAGVNHVIACAMNIARSLFHAHNTVAPAISLGYGWVIASTFKVANIVVNIIKHAHAFLWFHQFKCHAIGMYRSRVNKYQQPITSLCLHQWMVSQWHTPSYNHGDSTILTYFMLIVWRLKDTTIVTTISAVQQQLVIYIAAWFWTTDWGLNKIDYNLRVSFSYAVS